MVWGVTFLDGFRDGVSRRGVARGRVKGRVPGFVRAGRLQRKKESRASRDAQDGTTTLGSSCLSQDAQETTATSSGWVDAPGDGCVTSTQPPHPQGDPGQPPPTQLWLLAARVGGLRTRKKTPPSFCQKIRISFPDDIRSLDPRVGIDNSSPHVIKMLFDGLFRRGLNGDLEPAIAKSYTVSKV